MQTRKLFKVSVRQFMTPISPLGTHKLEISWCESPSRAANADHQRRAISLGDLCCGEKMEATEKYLRRSKKTLIRNYSPSPSNSIWQHLLTQAIFRETFCEYLHPASDIHVESSDSRLFLLGLEDFQRRHKLSCSSKLLMGRNLLMTLRSWHP